jgi:hypothetical protein
MIQCNRMLKYNIIRHKMWDLCFPTNLVENIFSATYGGEGLIRIWPYKENNKLPD